MTRNVMNTIKAAKVTQEFGERMMTHIKTSKKVSATVTEEVLELLLRTNQGNIDLIEALIAEEV